MSGHTAYTEITRAPSNTNTKRINITETNAASTGARLLHMGRKRTKKPRVRCFLWGQDIVVHMTTGNYRQWHSFCKTWLQSCTHARTSIPGALTVSPPTRAAMLRESLPPSTATPSCPMTWHMAWHASHRLAPSPGSLAAHIQFPLHFTSWAGTWEELRPQHSLLWMN